MDIGNNLAAIKNNFSIITDFHEFKQKPVIIGECDPEGSAARSARVNPANGYRNGSAYAAYEIALMKHTLELVKEYKINLRGVVTWAFLFDGMEYFEGFRTLSTNGIHKPVLNAFKILGMLRGKRIPVKSSSALGLNYIIENKVLNNPDIDGLATTTEQVTQVVIWNYHDDIITAEPVSIRLLVKAAQPGIKKAQVTHYRIDDKLGNAYTRWQELGSPQKPDTKIIEELKKAMHLGLLEPASMHDINNDFLKLDFKLPRFGVSLVQIKWA